MVETLGKYKIDGFIAEGGMARILRAKTEGIGGVEKTVALKCLKGSMQEDDSYVQMLLDEARITVRMAHKNIGQVYGLEHDNDKYFMVMEYIDGTNLAQLSQYLFGKNRIFPVEAAVFIAMEVCSGLSYAHRLTDDSGESLCIVHRDVNPQNICISKEGEVKLIDFGIAKAQSISSETQAGTIKGKFNYMSPEQARGDRVDQRTDVFALGAVLYEMLCGHMLYPLSLDDQRLRMKTRMADFVPIESYLPDIPEKLKKILNKALTRDINQRFATSRDFLLALTQFSHDSCRVYDSLDLSLLVAKYIRHQSKTDNAAISRDKLSPLSGANFNITAGNRNIGAEYSTDSSDTAVISAVEARSLAGAAPDDIDESATSVYSKADFDAAVASSLRSGNPQQVMLAEICSPQSTINRCVDLDVKNAGDGSTVMCKMDDMRPPRRIPELLKSIYGKVLAIDEKTLFIAATALGAILILAIVLFVSFRNDDEPDSAEESIEQLATEIIVSSVPAGAEILFDGSPSGLHTPDMINPKIEKTITLKLPFFQLYEIPKQELVGSKFTAKLIPLEVRLNLNSNPDGATVILNGEESGITPLVTKVPMTQQCAIVLKKPGYEETKKIITWKDENETDQNITINLKKK